MWRSEAVAYHRTVEQPIGAAAESVAVPGRGTTKRGRCLALYRQGQAKQRRCRARCRDVATGQAMQRKTQRWPFAGIAGARCSEVEPRPCDARRSGAKAVHCSAEAERCYGKRRWVLAWNMAKAKLCLASATPGTALAP